MNHLTVNAAFLQVVQNVIELLFRRHHVQDDPDCTDGVRLSWAGAWLHVRASATEPLLRIIAEAPTAARAEELVGDVVSFAQSIIAGPEARPGA